MNKMIFALLPISALLVSGFVSAEQPQKKKTMSTRSAITTAIKTTKTTWAPTAFDNNHDQLPPNYSGIDPRRFIKIFKEKVGKITKEEFETTEEFDQRIADKSALLSPISTIDLYAFRINNVPIKYDADRQNLLIGGSQDQEKSYTCSSSEYGQTSEWIICEVSEIELYDDMYIGTNAFGVSRKIMRIRGRDFELALDKNQRSLSSVLTKGNYYGHLFHDELSIPLEKVREIRNKKYEIAVLFVGRITDAKIIEDFLQIEPTIDQATDMLISKEGVPFELRSIIYYVFQTGEVLGRRNFTH